MKNLKGGYQLIDLEKNDLSSSFTLEGLYQTITLSNNKSLLVTGIVISGTKKNDVYTTYTKSGTSYIFEVYGKTLTVGDDDAVTVADTEKPTTLYLHNINDTLYFVNNVPTKSAIKFNSGNVRYYPDASDTSKFIGIDVAIYGGSEMSFIQCTYCDSHGNMNKVVNISHPSSTFVIEYKKESVSGATLTSTASTGSNALTTEDKVTKL